MVVKEGLIEVPEGWVKNDKAPVGYSWYNNGKSRFSGEYKCALVKDKESGGE